MLVNEELVNDVTVDVRLELVLTVDVRLELVPHQTMQCLSEKPLKIEDPVTPAEYESVKTFPKGRTRPEKGDD